MISDLIRKHGGHYRGVLLPGDYMDTATLRRQLGLPRRPWWRFW